MAFEPIVASGEIKGGQLVLDDRPALARAIRNRKDGRIVVTVKREFRGRTRQQEKYWHAVPVEILGEHFGCFHDEMHRVLLGEWSGWVDGPMGQKVPRIPTSTALSDEQYGEMIDWVLIWAPAEHGIPIPPPDKNWKDRAA